jgi:hypothetical protein
MDHDHLIRCSTAPVPRRRDGRRSPLLNYRRALAITKTTPTSIGGDLRALQPRRIH